MVFLLSLMPRANAAGLRIPVVVCYVVLHLKEQHHRVVFMNDVVAVHRPVTHKIPEAEEGRDVLAKLQPYSILAGYLNIGDIGTDSTDSGATSPESAVAAGPI